MTDADMTRRGFLRQSARVAGALSVAGGAIGAAPAMGAAPAIGATTGAVGRAASAAANAAARSKRFEISLAAWSVHRMFFANKLRQLDMPELCRKEFDIGGLEMVNTFFASPQATYCRELQKRADGHGVKLLLIMCDGEGDMSHPDKAERQQAVRNHRKWVDIAALLGCHSIRCNSGGGKPGDADAIARCAESFAQLVEYARHDKLNVIIENHGGLSSHAESLMEVVRKVNDPLFGTLPDFGNFPAEYDRYASVEMMMKAARAVSAKCHDFDEAGNETGTDYARMMRIVLDSGYTGWVGIEYEGQRLSEIEGVKACKKLLERFQATP